MNCPNCGHENSQHDRFCANCGTRLRTEPEIPRQFVPESQPDVGTRSTPTPIEPIPDDPGDPEWRMSSLPPEEPPKRRVWLWVLVGLILLCVLLICGLGIFLTTGTGQDLLDDLATRAATTSGTP